MFFEGTNVFNITVIMLIQIVHVLMLGVISALGTGRRIDLVATAVSAIFLLSLYQYENFTWGFQACFVGVFAFSTACFLVFVQGRPTLKNTSVASAIAFVACFTLANGVLIFPILLMMSFILARPRKQIALISAIALIAVLILFGAQSILGTSSKGLTVNFESLHSIVSFFLTYLGAPISAVLTTVDSRIFGFVAVILSLAMFITMLVHRVEIHKSDLILNGIALFVIGTALITTVGRYQMGLAAASASRYGSPVLLLWCCLLLWAYLVASRRSKALRGFATVAVLLIGLGSQIAGSTFVERADASLGRRYATETALLSGVPDHEALLQGFEDESLVLDVSELMKRSKLSIYAQPWSEWLGASIHEKSRIADPRRCAGGIENIERIVSDNRIFIRASGWAWDLASNHALRNIVLVDQNHKVIGFGRGPFAYREATPNATDSGELHRAFWRGHGNIDRPTEVAAFALIDDGKLVCRLSGEAVIDTTDLTAFSQMTYIWSPGPPVGVKVSGGAALNRALTLWKGWSIIEDWGVWTDGQTAEVAFDTEGLPDRFQITVVGSVFTPRQGSQQVRVLDQFDRELAAVRSTSSKQLSIAFTMDRKKYPRIAVIRFEIESPVSTHELGTPGARQLGFGLRSWIIDGLD